MKIVLKDVRIIGLGVGCKIMSNNYTPACSILCRTVNKPQKNQISGCWREVAHFVENTLICEHCLKRKRLSSFGTL